MCGFAAQYAHMGSRCPNGHNIAAGDTVIIHYSLFSIHYSLLVGAKLRQILIYSGAYVSIILRATFSPSTAADIIPPA